MEKLDKSARGEKGHRKAERRWEHKKGQRDQNKGHKKGIRESAPGARGQRT